MKLGMALDIMVFFCLGNVEDNCLQASKDNLS